MRTYGYAISSSSDWCKYGVTAGRVADTCRWRPLIRIIVAAAVLVSHIHIKCIAHRKTNSIQYISYMRRGVHFYKETMYIHWCRAMSIITCYGISRNTSGRRRYYRVFDRVGNHTGSREPGILYRVVAGNAYVDTLAKTNSVIRRVQGKVAHGVHLNTDSAGTGWQC